MRWIALAIIILSLPLIVAFVKSGERRRNLSVAAIGALLFASGELQLDASVISWPSWPGTSRGILLSFVDSIAVALLLTRSGRVRVPPFLIVSTLFVIPMITATLLASIKMASIFSLFQFAQIMLLFVVLSHELVRPDAIPSLLKGIAIGLIIQAGFVIQQKLTGVVQATGTLIHQNILGMIVHWGSFSISRA